MILGDKLDERMRTMYLCQLICPKFFHGELNLGVIHRISDLVIVRKLCKERYGLEFEDLSSKWTPNTWEFQNITDERDIKLFVERIDVLSE